MKRILKFLILNFLLFNTSLVNAQDPGTFQADKVGVEVVYHKSIIHQTSVLKSYPLNEVKHEYIPMHLKGQDEIMSMQKITKKKVQPIKSHSASKTVAKGSPKATDKSIKTNTVAKSSPPASQPIAKKQNKKATTEVFLTYQIGVYSTATKAGKYENKNIHAYIVKPGLYRYTYGIYGDYETAVAAKQEISNDGFPDAFIVGMKNLVKISAADARTLLD